jgi:transglutaminase/protease-like cytokinesis protein 3
MRLDHEAGELWFAPSPVYEHNIEIYSSYSPPRPSEYLEVELLDHDERHESWQLAQEITAGESTEYGKLLVIHDWVAQNIYYNWDGYLSGDYGRTDAHGTLENKASVCYGMPSSKRRC